MAPFSPVSAYRSPALPPLTPSPPTTPASAPYFPRSIPPLSNSVEKPSSPPRFKICTLDVISRRTQKFVFKIWVTLWLLACWGTVLSTYHSPSDPPVYSRWRLHNATRDAPTPELTNQGYLHIDSNPLSLPEPYQFPKNIISSLDHNKLPASLTVIFPCPSNNVGSRVFDVLYTLSTRFLTIGPHQTVIVCTQEQSREALRVIEDHHIRDVQVRITFADRSGPYRGLLHVASFLTSEWLLILDEEGISNTPLHSIALLHHPPSSLPVPFGPRGVVVSQNGASCVVPDAFKTSPISAAFLIPPFTIHSEVLRAAENGLTTSLGTSPWAALGLRIAQMRSNEGVGGIVVGNAPSSTWRCNTALSRSFPSGDVPGINRNTSHVASRVGAALFHAFDIARREHSTLGRFVIFLPTLSDLDDFAKTLCRMALRGHHLTVVLYDDLSSSRAWTYELSTCHLHYDVLAAENSAFGGRRVAIEWIEHNEEEFDAFIGAPTSQTSLMEIESTLRRRWPGLLTPVIKWLPRSELRYTEWAGTLTVEEWRAWATPRLDLVIITNDRPTSLDRLLRSISSAVYFGDHVNVHINLEQTADLHTISLVKSLNWTHGDVVVRHRVILGGLLPAIVESWYPSSDDTYGLLLEDDVELSPMFYAWAKMTLLRYRYGKSGPFTDRLFGISLYQQKSIELRTEGRRPFSARKLFTAEGAVHPNTPYLSQIPCSWGAIYFPQQWREFHEYLIDRLSEKALDIGEVVVPDIRSNRWTKSWKKFFIELVYLRGYVMLYPNYPNFTSFSTNHLEIGTHVRGDMSRSEFSKKRAQFELPLMALPDHGTSDKHPLHDAVLDMPFESLPLWESLPVVDLWGHMAQQPELVYRGAKRHQALFPGSAALNMTASDYNATYVLVKATMVKEGANG